MYVYAVRVQLTLQMDIPSHLAETVAAVRDDYSDASDAFVLELARRCHAAIGYYAAPGDGFPDGDVATCVLIASELQEAGDD